MANLATQVMLGKTLAELDLRPRHVPHFGVKEAVFPFNMFPEVDPVLGPEMRSTGEVLGLADSFGLAFYRAQEATQSKLPLEGTVLITVAEPDKPGVLEAARQFQNMGFRIRATQGTLAFLDEARGEVRADQEGPRRPTNIVDAITNGEIQLVVNTPAGKLSVTDDSYIRKSAIKYKVAYVTTTAAAIAAARHCQPAARTRRRSGRCRNTIGISERGMRGPTVALGTAYCGSMRHAQDGRQEKREHPGYPARQR